MWEFVRLFCLRHSAHPEYKSENSYPNGTHVYCPDTFFVPFYALIAKPSFFRITYANAFNNGTCTDVCLVFSFNQKHLNMMLLGHVYSLCPLHIVILLFNFLISSGLWFFKIKVCSGPIQAKSNSSHYIYCIVSVFSYNQTTSNYWLLSLITKDKRTDISPLTCSLCTKET